MIFNDFWLSLSDTWVNDNNLPHLTDHQLQTLPITVPWLWLGLHQTISFVCSNFFFSCCQLSVSVFIITITTLALSNLCECLIVKDVRYNFIDTVIMDFVSPVCYGKNMSQKLLFSWTLKSLIRLKSLWHCEWHFYQINLKEINFMGNWII